MITAHAVSPRLPTEPASAVRAALATLDRAQQRLIDAVVFEGHSCARIAQSIGAPVTDVRQRIGAAMRALQAELASGLVSAPAPEADDRVGTVSVMLVLRALDALDPDETELVDLMLLHQPALQRAYDEDCALVAALCASVPRVAPAPRAFAALWGAIDAPCDAGDDDLTAN